ncbi:MAG: PRD domain-containing protein [Actinobacteria bacterium]|nr:PRD domain-containing protein [Actinomycetota bacterium]
MTDSSLTSAHAQLAAEFVERLDLLEESGQVTNLARRLTELCLADLTTALNLTLTEDNAAQFVTHLAIALTRINRGDPEIVMSAVAAEEIADRKREHNAVTSVMRDASRLLQREVPDSEITYMTVHLCGLVDNEGGSSS